MERQTRTFSLYPNRSPVYFLAMAESEPDLRRQIVARMLRLSRAAELVARATTALRPNDRARAERFHFADDRARFVLGRALLEHLLTRYLHHPPGVELAVSERGRPFLVRHPTYQFSITHAGDLVAVALAVDTPVGLDLERVDRPTDLEQLATRIFGKEDQAQFFALPEPARAQAFFHAWTGKEARLKAEGLGLPGGLKRVHVPWEGGASSTADGWRFETLVLPEGYCGHAAWPDPTRTLDFREIEPGEIA